MMILIKPLIWNYWRKLKIFIRFHSLLLSHDNHIHLQIETIKHHPKDIMKMLNSRYAIYFNRRHHLVGHVFQGRYGAELIEKAEYFLEVSRYIHLNPVEDNIVKIPEAYPGAVTLHIFQTRTIHLSQLKRFYPFFKTHNEKTIGSLLKNRR